MKDHLPPPRNPGRECRPSLGGSPQPPPPVLADFEPGVKRLAAPHTTIVRLFWVIGLRITLSPGLYTDGASIPAFCQPLVGSPWAMPRLLAAIVHDALYGAHFAWRWFCDRIYLAIRLQTGGDRRLALLEYAAIRLGGKSAWAEKTSTTIAYTRARLSIRPCLIGVAGVSARSILSVALTWATLLCLTGCKTKTRNLDLAGMYASEAGTLAIGKIEVMSAPKGEESAHIRYKEDTAWLSPSTKTHEVKILITGTNAVDKVDSLVKSICEAFKVAASPTPLESPEPESQK